ncbi:MAG: nucleotide exchange factor GrpE [Chloroflexota bacterium]|nr:MAG: nucleotide exchange factor GrpE [Chloroflexota bacterium]
MDETREGPDGLHVAPAGRRHRTRAEERIAALEAPPSRAELLARTEELERELEAARQEAGESKVAWQRTAADFANFRRRTEQEREATLGLASELLLLKVVTLADDFDRALVSAPAELAGSGWLEGIEAIDRKLRQLLESEGVTPLEAQGRPFDPREHEAVSQVETAEVPDDTVISELQRGYRIRDRILRPALVSVAKNPGH